MDLDLYQFYLYPGSLNIMTTAKMMANISRGLHFTAGTIQSSLLLTHLGLASLVASWLKNPPAKAGDVGWIPGQKDPLEKEMGNPLQSCCLGNPMDRGAWWATINGVTKESDTTCSVHRLNNSSCCSNNLILELNLPLSFLSLTLTFLAHVSSPSGSSSGWPCSGGF